MLVQCAIQARPSTWAWQARAPRLLSWHSWLSHYSTICPVPTRHTSLAIPAVGNATQTKLKDLARAAADAGIGSFAFPFHSVNKGVAGCGSVQSALWPGGGSLSVLPWTANLDSCVLSSLPVRELQALMVWAEESLERCDATKKILKLTKGWEEAREHVFKVKALSLRLGGHWDVCGLGL